MKILYGLLVVALLFSKRKYIICFQQNSSNNVKKYVKQTLFYENRRNLKGRLLIKQKDYDYLKYKNLKNAEMLKKKNNQIHYVNAINPINENISKYELKSKALKKLYERELIHYISDIKNVDNILFSNENEKDETSKKSVYVGFDLGCRNLHIGNLVPLKCIEIIRNYNTDVIIVLGSSTTKIGDPSFQIKKRKQLIEDEILENEKEITKSIIHLLLQNEVPKEELEQLIKKANCKKMKEFIYKPNKSNSDGYSNNNINKNNYYTDDYKDYNNNRTSNKGTLTIVRNNMWYDNITVIDFLKYGEYFTINKLLRKECFLSKYPQFLTLKDLNYITLQAYDFLHLFKKYKTVIQIGGSDQWGNIQSGIELCQNIFNIQLFGLTTNLLLHKNNIKYSKSLFEETKNLPIWINKDKYAPFLFWNYIRNIEDKQLKPFMNMLTDIEIKKENGKTEIQEVNISYEKEINETKKKIADSVTAYVYGKEIVYKINKIKKAVKMNDTYKIENIEDLKVLPFLEIKREDLTENKISIIEILKRLEIATSNKDAKNKINQKIIYLNDDIIINSKMRLTIDNFVKTANGHYFILRTGKKTFYAVLMQ